MPHKFVSLEEQNGIAIVRVNRPEALNALNSAVLDELNLLFEALMKQRDLRAIILTGAGDKAFIAGADIGEMSKMTPVQALDFARKGQMVTQRIAQVGPPVIAAVNGYALGGGCELAIACDFIVASSNAVFGQPEVTIGLITGFGGAFRLADFVGWPMARELILTGRHVNAEEALQIGLANRVVLAPGKVLDEALKIAAQISANSPIAVKTAKAVMTKMQSESTLSGRLELEARTFSTVFATQDQKEGTRAFLEKRKPAYTGN